MAGTSWITRRWFIWSLFAVVLLLAPRVWSSSFGQTLLTQMGIGIIACLAYNILLGQGGMLSFGHAVYSGVGAFLAIHALNMAGAGSLALPVSLIPLVGGLAGLAFAAVLGYVSTKKSGTPFAMITLGLGELMFALALMLPEFSGGEGGVSSNRVIGAPVWGISFGPQIQVYYLVALYCFVCTAAMYAFTRTPLGRMLNAVRDNPERVEFIGYDTHWVRFLAFTISGFFAGIAGGLGAINAEIVNGEVLHSARSGAYLLFTFLGGATVFFGPIIGAVLMVVAGALLSELTQAWLLYLGLIFLFMVMYAPGGLASLILINLRVLAFRKFSRLALPYLMLAVTALLTLAGVATLIEMVYHRQLNEALGPEMHLLGLTLDSAARSTWLAAAALALIGAGLFEGARRRFVRLWSAIQTEIEAELRRRENA